MVPEKRGGMPKDDCEVSNSAILVSNDSIIQNRKFMKNSRFVEGCRGFGWGQSEFEMLAGIQVEVLRQKRKYESHWNSREKHGNGI